jgi:peptide/nickel transport system ATP-binding protein
MRKISPLGVVFRRVVHSESANAIVCGRLRKTSKTAAAWSVFFMTRELPKNDGCQALLSVRNLTLEYRRRRTFAAEHTETIALQDVTFDLRAGETLAVVGPSGSGKSSLARCMALLEQPSAGQILYAGANLHQLPPEELKRVRREIHLIFQDSASALNPRMSVRELVAEPLVIQGTPLRRSQLRSRVDEVLSQVELGESWRDRKPLDLSGGQRQRVALARALASQPKLLILDEALSSLDLSTQAQIANLLLDLQDRHPLAYLFITHDLRMAGALANQVVVLGAGRVVRRGLPMEVLTANLQPVS